MVGSVGVWVEAHGTALFTSGVQRWVQTPVSVRTCGMPLRRSVAIYYATRRPVVGGVRRCRNRFVCPYCSWCQRLALAARWRVVLDGFTDKGYVPSFVVLPLSLTARTPLRVVLADLMAAWKQFRAHDGEAWWRAGTECFAWSLDVVVGGPTGPHLYLRCFTVHRDSPKGATTQGRYIADLWFEAVESTKSSSVSPSGNVIHDYITGPAGEIVDYSLGIPTRSATGRQRLDARYRHQRTAAEMTLLDLALRVHLTGDTHTGRLLTAAASDLYRRHSYAESKLWKAAAAGYGHIIEPSEAAYTGKTDPEPICVITSSDYLTNKTAIEHWTDTTMGLSQPELTESLQNLLVRHRIKPVTTRP